MPQRRYRHPIQIQENLATEGGLRPEDDWQTTLSTYASIEPISANETFRNAQNIGEATHVVRMRYWCELTLKHRIKFRGRYFGIISIINENELDRYFELICKEEI